MKVTKDIHELILAYLREDISEEEMSRLRVWLDENERHQRLLEELWDKDVLQREIVEYASFDTSRRWEQLKEVMEKPVRKGRSLLKVWGAVAAVVVAFVGGLIYWQMAGSSQPETKQVAVARIEQGGTRAVLITGTGKHVVLQGLKDTCLNITGMETLNIGEDGSLKYSLSALSSMPEWHTLRIPKGGEYKIVLDDGTEIWLNSASELKYPAHFVGNERRVQLTGEAYFQVARNEAAPFIVETRDMDVKVLGTSFNVRDYQDENFLETTLVNGKVAFERGGNYSYLKPGEQLRLNKEDGKTTVETVDVLLYCSWKDGRFVFEKQRLEVIMNTIARWYNINVFYESSSVKDILFTGNIKRYSDLEQVVNMLKLINKIDIEIKDRNVFVRSNE